MLLLLVGIMFGSQLACAQLQLHELFQDSMVLQRNAPLSIYGTAKPNSKISISFLSNTYNGVADARGNWELEVGSFESGGPYSMTVLSENEKIVLNNILIGDVWVCSGQSNMEWPLRKTLNAEAEINQANYVKIRHIKMPKSAALFAEHDLVETGGWQAALPGHVGDFSGIGYYFAKNLHSEYDIPIGLINSTWGGSNIKAWMGYQALGLRNPQALADTITRQRERLKVRQESNLTKQLGELPYEEIGIDASGNYLWTDPAFDDSLWKEMKLPSHWEKRGLDGLDGKVWFRKTIQLDQDQASADTAFIHLGSIDDSDETWINGVRVGGMRNTWNVPRQYPVASGVLKKGENVIVVKVTDHIQRGGFRAKPDNFYLRVGQDKINLEGLWKYKVADIFEENLGRLDFKMPGLLYNKMIHPLHKFPVKGIIWYQGESDASEKDAFVYRERFKNMITYWRQAWGQEDLPFIFVQLANFKAPTDEPKPSNWAVLRESQSQALSLPATGEAVIIDLGEEQDIHPRNKKDVGYRLYLAAQSIAYDQNIVYTGPRLDTFKIVNNKVLLEFSSNDLVAKGNDVGNLYEFTVAGADQKFYRAHAKIEDGGVVLWSDQVKKPIAVRYAWADNPDKANLYNLEGLPASPFRTDTWPE